MRLWLAMLPAVLLAGQTAHAEYGATRWGMTPDEVVAAVGGDARKIRDVKDKRILDHKRLVLQGVVDGDLAYEVSYFFGKDGKGLSMVNLVPATSDANCAATRAAFGERFGAGTESTKTIIEGLVESSTTWRTGPREEVVEYLEIRLSGTVRHCQVLYQQLDGTKN